MWNYPRRKPSFILLVSLPDFIIGRDFNAAFNNVEDDAWSDITLRTYDRFVRFISQSFFCRISSLEETSMQHVTTWGMMIGQISDCGPMIDLSGLLEMMSTHEPELTTHVHMTGELLYSFIHRHVYVYQYESLIKSPIITH